MAIDDLSIALRGTATLDPIRRSPTRRIPPRSGLLSKPATRRDQVRVVRTGRRPATHDLRARRGRAGGGPSPSRNRSGWRADSRSCHGGRRPRRAPAPRGREPTDRTCFAHARPVTDYSRLIDQHAVNRLSAAWRSGGRGDGSAAPRQRFFHDATYRRAGSTLRALRDMCPELRNKCLQLRNKSGPAEGDDRAVCRDFATYCGAEARKRNSALSHPHLETPSSDQTSRFAGPSPDLLRSSGPF